MGINKLNKPWTENSDLKGYQTFYPSCVGVSEILEIAVKRNRTSIHKLTVYRSTIEL